MPPIAPDLAPVVCTFLPAGFNPAAAGAIDEVADRLLARSLPDAPALQNWINDWSELASWVEAGRARRYIAMTLDTRDEDVRADYLAYERDVMARWKVRLAELDACYLASPHRTVLQESARPGWAVFDRRRTTAAELHRDENVDLQAQERALAASYSKLLGSLAIEMGGKTFNLKQAATRMEDPDRAVREEAWRAIAKARLAERERIDDIFDQIVALRTRVARNAGFENYLDYRFRELGRVDYGPDDCRAFHDAAANVAVPLLDRWAAERKAVLGVARLRPWDMGVRLTEAEAPSFPPERVEEVARELFTAIDPSFRETFETLRRHGLLDLETRPGKAPGGYNYLLQDVRLPFVFVNASGSAQDLRTLLHEIGHAAHSVAVNEEPVWTLRRAPIEFSEVASMSMELFGLANFDAVLPAEQARGLARAWLRRRVDIFGWASTIDAFQHWVYTHPDHTRAERTAQWRSLHARFAPWLDHEELAEARDTRWQSQPHLFSHPLYYLEYALAQLGAFQVWQGYRADRNAAVARYRDALGFGGRLPLPALYDRAGARFGFDRELLAGCLDDVVAQVEQLS